MIKPIIRNATAADLPHCLGLDASFETDHVWQMDSRSEHGQISVSFRSVRLPRSMRVLYPRDARLLSAGWQSCDAMLIAEDNGALVGYAALAKRAPQSTAWVQDLIVSKAARRAGVGQALLAWSVRWAREQQLSWLVVEVQTKNYPALSFCQKNGLTFCGYNDHYYANQDIALFFAKAIH